MSQEPEILRIDIEGGLMRKSLARQVYEALERAITDARIPPGTRLAEEAVAAAFSVSRSPAREAIMELERVRLAERLPNRDRRVTVPSEQFINDTYDVWILLESERLAAASHVAPPDLIARLEAQAAEMERLTTAGNMPALRGVMGEFHTDMQRGCPNRQLDRMSDDWYIYIRWFRRLYFGYQDEANERGLADHHRILACFRTRDGAGLRATLRSHLEWHRERVLEAWRQSGAAALIENGAILDFALKAQFSASA